MSDLIWVGNTLLPRWFVFGAIWVIAIFLIGLFVCLTEDKRP